MQSQCRLDWDFLTSGEKELHRRKARVHQTICVLDRSRLVVCSSFDSGPCLACLVRMRDEVLLLHNGDNNYLFCSGSETFLIRLQIAGYHHVDILPPHQKYLGFSWTLAGEKKWFVLSVLTFRLASAPYVFTKIQKALVKHWRQQCIRIFTYLNDGAASRRVREDIAASGFVARPEKRCWEPTQVRESLGFILNLDFLFRWCKWSRTGRLLRECSRHQCGRQLVWGSEQRELDMEGAQRNEAGAYVHWGRVGRKNGTT